MKILFVGDLRTANNYGAIATTETLNNMLVQAIPDAEIQYIDYRSLYFPTPVSGWPASSDGVATKIKGMVKLVAKKVLPIFLRRLVKQLLFSAKKSSSYVPYKVSLYDEYYARLQKGEILGFEKRMLEWADMVYINGEGNIVNGVDKYGKYRNGGLYILFMAWLAKEKFQKKTFMVNHTVDPANKDVFEMIEKVYPGLDKVYVRETLSLAKLQEVGVDNGVFVPDALFGYQPIQNWQPSAKLLRQIDFSKPYICIGDSSGIKNMYNQVKWDVVKVLSELIEKLKDVMPQIIFVDGYNGGNSDVNKVVRNTNIGIVNLKNCSYHDLFYVLQGAEIFVSGRWHASILSVLANTPILLWGSDSHKTKSLYTLLDYPYSFYEVNTFPIHIDEMVNEVKKIIQEKLQVKRLLNEKLSVLSGRAIENVAFLGDF
ncbi:polysaccharide pyruvyl transferase family protein [Geofilum sp. OHC36d9]|uniref:polysaccharide pyruvyl transferase family protein n=1 Tax=Geofilum sp. OHC36d9 TaxID=3458413 RepID=UPI004033282C